MKICMWMPGNAEFSLCGDAFDAVGDPTCDTPEFRIGETGERIACPACKSMIRQIKEVKQYRVPDQLPLADER